MRDTEFREQLKQAEANLQIAQTQAKQADAELERISTDYRRSMELAQKNLISPTEQETAKSKAIPAEADAVMQSARLRLRPILMTTCTTVLGMLPLAFVLGAGGEIQAALARAVIGGLTVSTLITLILVPVVYTTYIHFWLG